MPRRCCDTFLSEVRAMCARAHARVCVVCGLAVSFVESHTTHLVLWLSS